MKIAAKLLSQSDLTIFEAFYRQNRTSKQKGINLNGNVLADQFYGSLPRSLTSADELPVTLDIHGPHGAPLHRLRRKIVKSQGGKNWRLNGKLVEEPADQQGRYSNLAVGDVALLGFVGERAPSGVIMIILAQSDPANRALRDRVVAELGLMPGSRSMVGIVPETLLSFLDGAADAGPLAILLPDHERGEDIQETALGDPDAEERLRARTQAGRTRSVSSDELAAAQQRATEIGRAGEVLINELLADHQLTGRISDYTWDADVDALAPHDFTIVNLDRTIELIDVKSTTGVFNSYFHISLSELKKAESSTCDYRIYRVYGLDSAEGPRLKRSNAINFLAREILSKLADLPTGMRVASLQLSPDLLEWSEEFEPLALEEEA